MYIYYIYIYIYIYIRTHACIYLRKLCFVCVYIYIYILIYYVNKSFILEAINYYYNYYTFYDKPGSQMGNGMCDKNLNFFT